MEIQQHSQAHEKIEKLGLENADLKKQLEREQLLHAMLYKEWKELNDRVAAKEQASHESGTKNVFYKYAFYLLLISIIPAYYFMSAGTGKEKITSSSQPASVSTPTTSTKDSTPTNKKLTTTGNLQKQSAIEQPGVKLEKKRKIQPDTSNSKTVMVNRPVVESLLTDSTRDLIYWQGWNAYYNRSRNQFKKSSQGYKVWLEGWNDGKNDAKKLLAKDSTSRIK